MMSSEETSSPVSPSTLAYLMRWPVLRLIWLKLTFSVSDVAGYSATGQVTNARRQTPFQLARGARALCGREPRSRKRFRRATGGHGILRNTQQTTPRVPPGNRLSKRAERET